MDKIFASLLESEILTEDTKNQLEEAVKTQLDEAVQAAKAEAEVEVRAELTKQFIEEKEQLVEALDTKAEEFLNKELEELKEDISRFRDLEVEYSERLVEHKQAMAETLKSDLEELVEAMDTFIEMRLRAEMEELKESIDEVRKNKVGQQIFEQFEEIYASNFAGSDTQAKSLEKLEEAKAELDNTRQQLEEATSELNQINRDAKMQDVLKDLDGKTKEVMEAILKSIPTDQLEEAYQNFIPRVLHESAEQIVENDNTEEKEDKVLAEGQESTTKEADETVIESATSTVTGDSVVEESEEQDTEVKKLDESVKHDLQKLAGIE